MDEPGSFVFEDRVKGKPFCKGCGYECPIVVKYWQTDGWRCTACKIRDAIEAHRYGIRRLEKRLVEVFAKRKGKVNP